MYKKILFSLMVIIFLSFQLASLAQSSSGVRPQPLHGSNHPSTATPPIILISGKERESFHKVFIDKVKIGDEINLSLLMFDHEPAQEIKINSYGLPDSAQLNVKKNEKEKNRAQANSIWKPEKSDKGFHTIVIEVLNSKGAVSRISLSYDVN